MAGFTFGSNPTTTTTAGTSFTFGSNAPSLSFGAAGGNTGAAPSGGLTFGAPAGNTSTIGGLGTVNTQAQQPSTGFTFGSSATPGSTGGLSFGAGAGTAGTAGGLNFKGPTAPTSGGFAFGATQQQPQQQPPTFGSLSGATMSTPSTGLSLLSSTTPASTAASQPQSTFTFGGAPQTNTASVTPSLFGSTAPTIQATVLPTFGTGTATTTVVSALKPATTLTFGTAPVSSISTSTTFGFSAPPLKTTAATGFTLSAPTSTSAGSSGGLFGFSVGTSTTAPTATTISAPVFKGLGGVDTTQSLSGIGGTPGIAGTGGSGRLESKTAKENQVPNDIIQSIESFKGFVKSQKNLSCEVARASVKPMGKVTQDTQALRQLLSLLSAEVQKNNFLAEKLKSETSKLFTQCEMAQRTHDTPAGLQNDNTAPLEFFINLAAKFEHSVHVLRQEIDNTEKHVNSLSQQSVLTPQELSLALKRLHESFVALAGRLQVVHQAVVAQKERHLSLRKHFLKDATDIFAKPDNTAIKKSTVNAGPTPFSAAGGIVQTLGILANQDKTISPFGVSGGNITGWGSGPASSNMINNILLMNRRTGGSSSSLFNTGTFSSGSNDTSGFQLLKPPPPGNKRGKR